MSNNVFLAVAEVLDKLAEAEECREKEHLAPPKEKTKEKKEEKTAANDLMERAQTAGSPLTLDEATKIASDPKIAEIFTKALEAGSRPTSMGGPSEKRASNVPVTKAERLQAAFDNWGNAITGG
jgi:hypothetical protein